MKNEGKEGISGFRIKTPEHHQSSLLTHVPFIPIFSFILQFLQPLCFIFRDFQVFPGSGSVIKERRSGSDTIPPPVHCRFLSPDVSGEEGKATLVSPSAVPVSFHRVQRSVL